MIDLGSGIGFSHVDGVLSISVGNQPSVRAGAKLSMRQALRLAAELTEWAKRQDSIIKRAAAKRMLAGQKRQRRPETTRKS